MDIKRIINTSKPDDQGFHIVIAEVSGVHPFVTWLKDQQGSFHYGDYCSTLEGAMLSYFERCNENGIEA